MNAPEALDPFKPALIASPRGALIEQGGALIDDLAEFLPHFDRMSRQLNHTSKQIEDSVVEVCGSFQSIANHARAAVEKTSGFLSSQGEGSAEKHSFDELIAACGRTMVKILSTTEEAEDVSRRAIERVQKIDHSSCDISKALAQLDQIAQENKMLAMNARIEAAHAGALGTGFAVVAVEVVSQTEKTKAVAAQANELIEGLRALADSAVRDLRQIRERDLKHLEECREEVNSTLRQMQATHASVERMLSSLSEESSRLANEIGAAVRGLQFQDRTSQQIGHVVEDLKALHSRLAVRLGHAEKTSDTEFSQFTMREERAIAGCLEQESAAGDVELF